MHLIQIITPFPKRGFVLKRGKRSGMRNRKHERKTRTEEERKSLRSGQEEQKKVIEKRSPQATKNGRSHRKSGATDIREHSSRIGTVGCTGLASAIVRAGPPTSESSRHQNGPSTWGEKNRGGAKRSRREGGGTGRNLATSTRAVGEIKRPYKSL